MKRSSIGVLFIAAAVLSILVTACFSDWTGEEEEIEGYGTLVFTLAQGPSQ